MKLDRRTLFLAGAAALGLTIAGAGLAQAWEPNKPVDFVIMAGKGGGADKMGRLMQSAIVKNEFMGLPLVPVNKPGGTGAEALIALNQAKDPDHTLLVTLNSFFTTPLTQPGLKVDIMTFAPVGLMAEDTFVLWVHKDEEVHSLDEFVAKAKAEGDGWVMGGTGKASEDELLTRWLNTTFGLSMKYIPYKGGGEVAKELAGRQVRSTVNNPSEAQGFYESGDVVPIVAFTDERIGLYPDTPTVKELGHDFSYYMQRAVVGAPGMSDEALAYWVDLFKRTYESEDWQNYIKTQGLTGAFRSGDELKAYWAQQLARHEAMLKESGAIKSGS